MKKYLLLLMSAFMLTAFMACGGDDDDVDDPKKEDPDNGGGTTDSGDGTFKGVARVFGSNLIKKMDLVNYEGDKGTISFNYSNGKMKTITRVFNDGNSNDSYSVSFAYKNNTVVATIKVNEESSEYTQTYTGTIGKSGFIEKGTYNHKTDDSRIRTFACEYNSSGQLTKLILYDYDNPTKIDLMQEIQYANGSIESVIEYEYSENNGQLVAEESWTFEYSDRDNIAGFALLGTFIDLETDDILYFAGLLGNSPMKKIPVSAQAGKRKMEWTFQNSGLPKTVDYYKYDEHRLSLTLTY